MSNIEFSVTQEHINKGLDVDNPNDFPLAICVNEALKPEFGACVFEAVLWIYRQFDLQKIVAEVHLPMWVMDLEVQFGENREAFKPFKIEIDIPDEFLKVAPKSGGTSA